MNIVFLHIPKTAGQSIHNALVGFYGKEAVCPARVNAQLMDFSFPELAGYKVYSGHHDWEKLDFVAAPKCVFTILRDPRERLASFYFYLKNKAERMTDEELARAGKGLSLAKNLTLDGYFSDMTIPERGFLDDHYDNFYTYYFAGRRYDARVKTRQHFGNNSEGHDRLVKRALENLKSIDIVGDVNDLKGFEEKFSAFTGDHIPFSTKKVNINQDMAQSDSRYEKLMALEMTAKTRARIESFVKLDLEFYQRQQ